MGSHHLDGQVAHLIAEHLAPELVAYPILPIDDDHEAVTMATEVAMLEWDPPVYWSGYGSTWVRRVVFTPTPAHQPAPPPSH